MYYAGIGSRKTPSDMLIYMAYISKRLAQAGYVLRSGGAIGADQAFERGAKKKEIFYACDATKEAIELASQYHNNWSACGEGSQLLHGRNAMIILGEKLDNPVDFVICWAKSEERGGTSMGIKIARDNNIPVYNLAKMDMDKFCEIMACDILGEQ